MRRKYAHLLIAALFIVTILLILRSPEDHTSAIQPNTPPEPEAIDTNAFTALFELLAHDESPSLPIVTEITRSLLQNAKFRRSEPDEDEIRGVLENALKRQPEAGQAIGDALMAAVGALANIPGVTEETLKERVVKAGKLPLKRDVPIDFLSKPELAEYLAELFESEYPRDSAVREETVLKAFGFLEPGDNLRLTRAKVLFENIAGFYDERPGVKKLFAIKRPSSATAAQTISYTDQMILAHELRHAIQDQTMDFSKILPRLSDYDDRKLAALSFIEGDATLLMEQYMKIGALGGLGNVADIEKIGGVDALIKGRDDMPFGLDDRAFATALSGRQLRESPRIVREQMLAPYLDGARFVRSIYRKGGYELINTKLRNLPSSMEQVLHPEKYLQNIDPPIVIPVPRSPVPGDELYEEGVIGEFYISVLLSSEESHDDAASVSEGWGGDRYALYKGENGIFTLIWQTSWDSVKDAKEFYKALVSFSNRVYGENTTVELAGKRVKLIRRDICIANIMH